MVKFSIKSNYVRATAFPEPKDVNVLFWILRSAPLVKWELLCAD